MDLGSIDSNDVRSVIKALRQDYILILSLNVSEVILVVITHIKILIYRNINMIKLLLQSFLYSILIVIVIALGLIIILLIGAWLQFVESLHGISFMMGCFATLNVLVLILILLSKRFVPESDSS